MRRKNSLQSHKKVGTTKNKIVTVDLKNYSELIAAKYQISDIKTGFYDKFMIFNGFENSLSKISSNYKKVKDWKPDFFFSLKPLLFFVILKTQNRFFPSEWFLKKFEYHLTLFPYVLEIHSSVHDKNRGKF